MSVINSVEVTPVGVSNNRVHEKYLFWLLFIIDANEIWENCRSMSKRGKK